VISLHYCDASVDCHLNIDSEVLWSDFLFTNDSL